MTGRRLAILAALLAGALSAAAGRAADSDALTLRQLLDVAQHDNKDLQAARYAVEIGRGRLVQAGLLPNPRLDLAGRSDFAFKNEGEYGNSLYVTLPFPVAGRILRQKDVARIDVALAQAEVAEAERQLAGDVAAAVYRVLVLDQQIQSRTELADVEERLAKATRDRLKAAEVSELDVNTVQLDLQRLAQERVLLQSQRRLLLVSLNTLVGRSAESALLIVEPLPDTDAVPGLEELQARALASRPDLRSARLNADRAQAETALAKASRWEDWSVGVGVEQDKLAIEGVQAQSSDRAIGLNLSIPIPLFDRNQGAISAAVAAGRQADARIEALELAVAGEVSSAHAEALNLQQLLNQYRTDLLPVSERNMQLAGKGYSQGQVSVLEAFQAQRQNADLNAAYLNTLDQFLQALVRLRTATGEYLAPPASASVTDDKDP
ncbi:MAG: TolC family protein [Gammaproteobacteria bacterium]